MARHVWPLCPRLKHIQWLLRRVIVAPGGAFIAREMVDFQGALLTAATSGTALEAAVRPSRSLRPQAAYWPHRRHVCRAQSQFLDHPAAPSASTGVFTPLTSECHIFWKIAGGADATVATMSSCRRSWREASPRTRLCSDYLVLATAGWWWRELTGS